MVRKTMKQITLSFVIAILLVSCFFITPQPREFDQTAIHTAAWQTAVAQITLSATAQAPTATNTIPPSPTLPYSPTASLTPSPFPAEIESLLQGKCEKPWQSVLGVNIPSGFFLIPKYGDKGCKLPIFSPNKEYLAYVTLDVQENEDAYVDAVKILQTTTGKVQDVYFAHEKDFVATLEWSPTGQLLIWESIWEGSWVIFICDPAGNSIVSTMRLNPSSELEWNPINAALYAEHSYGYGAGVCIAELRGYDFAHDNSFPDFYEIFNVEKNESDPFGIPSGKSDDLAVEPFAWSKDGRYLWVTVRLLHQQENDWISYEVGPGQAGVLEFTEEAITFKLLASDPNLDYSFEGSPVPKLVSSPYLSHRCP
jgi:hypothetical protein